MLELQLIIELMVLGLATGFMAGLLGIGGGMLLGPFLTIILLRFSQFPAWCTRNLPQN